MRAAGASLFPLVIIGLLAGLTFWLERASEVDDAGSRANRRHEADFFVDRFTLRRFGPEGELQHSLTATRMLHYPDDDTTTVSDPHLTYFGASTTTVTSNSAWLDKDGKHVRLDEDVRVVRAATEDAPETIMTTSVLFVTPDDELAQTDAPVTITQGKSIVHGVGLEANNKTHIAILSGPVRGTFYRNPTP